MSQAACDQQYPDDRPQRSSQFFSGSDACNCCHRLFWDVLLDLRMALRRSAATLRQRFSFGSPAVSFKYAQLASVFVSDEFGEFSRGYGL
jgi:hypothetical protein